MTKNGRISAIALIAGIVLCIAARTVGILSFTDMKTGFLFHESTVLYCVIFFGLCVCASVITAVTAPKAANKEISEKGMVMLGCITVLIAAFAVYDGINGLNSIKPFTAGIVVDFVMAAYIFVVGVMTVRNKEMTPLLGFLYSVIGAYYIFLSVAGISQRMGVLTYQEYLLDALTTTSGGVFLALFGKFYSGNGEKRTLFFMRLWAAITAVFSLSSSFGTILAKIFGSKEISERITASPNLAQLFFQENALSAEGNYMMSFAPWVNLLIGVFAVAAIFISYSEKKD